MFDEIDFGIEKLLKFSAFEILVNGCCCKKDLLDAGNFLENGLHDRELFGLQKAVRLIHDQDLDSFDLLFELWAFFEHLANPPGGTDDNVGVVLKFVCLFAVIDTTDQKGQS
jgi:hypothetical protein